MQSLGKSMIRCSLIILVRACTLNPFDLTVYWGCSSTDSGLHGVSHTCENRNQGSLARKEEHRDEHQYSTVKYSTAQHSTLLLPVYRQTDRRFVSNTVSLSALQSLNTALYFTKTVLGTDRLIDNRIQSLLLVKIRKTKGHFLHSLIKRACHVELSSLVPVL